ncbi:fungal transcriptional regulatory protein [Colletotrichum truncatum]|uniref:Fungal transcriptional regulatory protein n=1 Tax=Colletotrichum truncatum TaxID=5467 RepID=A0ACC3YNS6_COLTU
MLPEDETSTSGFASNPKKLRACSTCARLKIRCRWPPATRNDEATTCTRCLRQGIRCQVPEQVPRKKRGKSRFYSRVTELEKKIDGLVNLFQSQQQPQHPESSSLTPETTASRNEEHHIRQILSCASAHFPPLNDEVNSQSNSASSSPDCNTFSSPDSGPSPGSLQLVPGLSVSIQEAEEYLNIYRTRMVPHFPFVPISFKTTAIDVHREKRFLFWCIIQSVVPQSAVVQKLVDDWIRKHAAIHIIVNREKKLEYLQGLLLYYAWGDINIQAGMSANGLLSLVIGLVSDMSFNKFVGPLSWMPKNMRSDAFTVITKGKQFDPPKPSLEEQRAIAGGYFVASSVGSSMRRPPQIHYTTQIAQCCKSIREARELATDDNLLALIRMQRVADRLRAVFPVFEREEEDPIPLFKEHYGVILSSLRKEMDSLPSEEIAINKQNPFIWSQYLTLLVRVYEPAIAMRAVTPSETNHLTEIYSRAEALWTCLQSIQDAMDALNTIPAESYAYLNFVLVSNTAFVILAATRLLLEDGSHDWDVTLARRKIDHAENLRRVMERFEEADNFALIEGQKRRLFEDNTSRWSNYAYRARWMRQWYISKVAPVPQELPVEQATNIAEGAVSDENMSWPIDLSMEQVFWEQMMLNGMSSFNFDPQFNPDMMSSTEGIGPVANLIPQ